MKKFFKIGFFYFVAFSMILGNSIVSIDFSTSLAHAEELEIPIIETTAVVPYPVPVVQAFASSTTSGVFIDWEQIDDGRLDGYKVVMSETNPNPAWPGDGYLEYIIDPSTTTYLYTPELNCGEDYYFSVTALYNEHDVTVAGNAVTINIGCEENLEPSCEGADLELPVDLYVAGANCDISLPIHDSEVVNLVSGGNYDVYTVANRDALGEDTTYGQDNEEFTIRVNSSAAGSVVLDQPAGQVWNIQNAGNFDFVSGNNTVHMDTAFDCVVAGDPMARNSVTVTKLCLYQTEPTSICGNGVLEAGEECDDGSDGSASCTNNCTLIEEECSIENSLIVNGSFEEPEVTSNDLWQRMSSVLAWIIEKVSDNSATTLELHKGWSSNVASDGLQYSELDGDHSTRVIQNVVTEVGAEYKLFWSFAPRHDILAEQNNLSVKVNGSQVATNGPAVGNAPLAQSDWTKSNYIFTANNTNTEIAFEDIGPSNTFGTFLDDVRLCKISNSEPSDNIPVITLIGSPIVNVDHSSVYTDSGATASDVEDGNITGDITTVNPVNTAVAGTYTITYNVSDSDGNNAVEVTRIVVVGAPYAPWCSVLFGALKDFYTSSSTASGEWNDVIDMNDDEVVDLSDISLLSQMYYAGDNEVCYAQFEDPTDEYHFQCEDPNVGWCGGLLQGITDSINKADRYFEVFDVYKGDNLGVINLSDLSVVSELMANNNQVDCYSYYVPPFFMCQDQKPYCGDGIVNQEIEQCDGDKPQSCTTADGYDGMQNCNMPSDRTILQSVEQKYCVWNSCLTEEYCGDSIQNGLEQCDAGPNGSDTCSVQCEVIPTEPCVGCGGGSSGGGGGGGTSFSIKSLESSVSCQAFNISWKTTRSSDTMLELGTESGVYTQHIDKNDNTLNHVVVLPGLLPDTTYYYKVRAIANANGLEISLGEKTFKTPPAEQCEEVLGEKIEGDPEVQPLICDFLRPSGSHGEDSDIHGKMGYSDGSLLRDACNNKMPVYLIKDQKKWHVPNWQYLHDNHFGQRIYNVLTDVLDKFPDWAKVLGMKEYADGTLLRAPDFKIYVLENGYKQHIKNLEELAKYAGREIINVSDEVINRY